MSTATSQPQTSAQAPKAITAKPPSLAQRVQEPTTLLMLVALAAAVVIFFRHWIHGQHLHSWGSGDWSHAYFVPFISVYILWQNRQYLERVKPEVFWPGLIPLLTGIWSYAYFIVGFPNHFGQGASLVLCVFGLTLLLLGPRMMEGLFMPVAFLIFAITVPERVMNYVTYPLQDMAAHGGFIVLRICGVTADLSGNVINVIKSSGEIHPLNVAEQCSGMRMVIAFMALGVAVAFVGTRVWWKRVVLLSLAVPVAVGLNVIRVAVLGFASMVDDQLAQGEAHTLIGTLLLVPGFFLFLGVLVAMNKAAPDENKKSATPAVKGAAA